MHGGGISAKITGVFVVVVAFEMQWYLLFLLWVCGLWFTGNPGGPLSVPPVYPDGTLGQATSPGGGGGSSAVTRDSTPTCFSSPQSMAFLLAEVTLTTETATAAETCSKRASRDTRWASPSLPPRDCCFPPAPAPLCGSRRRPMSL